ncbi:cytochrome P450 [Actinophytocola sp.]|uniref:cytochrome P450 n=1 Tax=Actinophytocola sp. TaxID=1872138 RepID=UPI003D6B15AA
MPTTDRRRLMELTGLMPLSATTGCADPQAAYRELQDSWGGVAPVELEPGVHAWLVMGHHELCQVVRNEQFFSCDSANWRLLQEGIVAPDSGLGAMMFPRASAYFADGDQHRRLRSPLDDAISSLDEHRLARFVRATCADQINSFADRGTADLIGEYAAVVSIMTVAGLFGVNQDHQAALRVALIAMFGAESEAQAAAGKEVERILGDTMNARRTVSSDDLTSLFMRHSNLRGDAEVAEATVLMMGAGYEAVTNWIAHTLRMMLSDARFAGRLRGGRLGLDDALDEVLWRDPPMPNMPARYALVDCELAGHQVQRGDALILGMAAANADQRVHTDDPWLEIGNRAHLAWSAGPHACPAQRPARMITRIAVDTALHQLPDVSLAIPPDEVQWLPSPWSRCPASLPVRFTPRTRPRN